MNQRPDWLTIRGRNTEGKTRVERLLQQLSLHTVCQEAACPNLLECFGRNTATFMILGNNCTRNCRFCNVTHAAPTPVDEAEPQHVAEAVEQLKLKHVVITSVTRDDLADGGSEHFANVIRAIQKRTPQVVVEVLIPDFQGDEKALETVIQAQPQIINHNIETVPSLYPSVRPQAVYARSLELLRRVREKSDQILTKSGIMVGLGETQEEVLSVLQDLRAANCSLLTIGQYLPPSKKHIAVAEYVPPETFSFYKEQAYAMGFQFVASAPLVRSSYHADEALKQAEGGLSC
jgi:lipoic acid synthetase